MYVSLEWWVKVVKSIWKRHNNVTEVPEFELCIYIYIYTQKVVDIQKVDYGAAVGWFRASKFNFFDVPPFKLFYHILVGRNEWGGCNTFCCFLNHWLTWSGPRVPE